MKTAYILYTDTTAKIPAPHGAASFTYKKPGASSVTVPGPEGGFFIFSAPAAPGSFSFQIFSTSGEVIEHGTFEVRQNLATAPADYDPRSEARKTLEALDAKIAGRALTIQQTKITVGDRSIEYMNSIDELLKWRDHFARIVGAEEGHAPITAEVCLLRRM
ncbi:MAG: hypothetical protein IJI85_10355 [Clostridia bacterium]|nr:hypothetical protein [Lentisphaeria bacterium]MBR0422961.1 hypothetical protein [Clostridia bacterium]